MSEQSFNELNPTRLSPAARIRAIADAEIDPEHARGIDDAEARIAFERALRDAVGRSMGASPTEAPPQIREQIEAILGAGDAREPDVVQTPMGDTRHPSFWTGMGRFITIAAVLTICAIVIILSSRHGGGVAHAGPLQAGLLASFAEQEHEHCENDKAYEETVILAKTREQAESLARKQLGAVPPLIRDASEATLNAIEDAGFVFAGMGPCHVPGKGPSVHVIFRDVHSQNHIASLFIQVDRGQWDLDEKHSARLKDNLEDEETVFVWLDQGFLHILFVDSAADGKALRAALHIPTEECQLKAR